MDLSPRHLRDEVVKMAACVESTLSRCLDEQTLLEQLLELEDKVNLYHTTIDDGVFKYIALKHPAAKDLREALAIMKINTDLERMADQAINIKRFWDSVSGQYSELYQMKNEVLYMVKNCLDAFVQHDVQLAQKVIEHDSKVNQLNREIAKNFVNKMKSHGLPFDEGYSVIRIVKNLERIGDLATNICEDVIFLESGADIRHKGQRTLNKNTYNIED